MQQGTTSGLSPKMYLQNDEPSEKDLLHRLHYIDAFVQVALKSNAPLVVGVYGGWGTGKTTLMRLIKKKLDEDEEGKVGTVWFDPNGVGNSRRIS